MTYKISDYTKKQASKLNVKVKPSKNKKKKIDVFNKKGEKVGSAGAKNYGDFPTFKKEKGKEYADKKRKAFRARHDCSNAKSPTNKYWACELLW